VDAPEAQGEGGGVTNAEREWCEAIVQIGCIACIVSTGIYGTPGAVHHLLSGGRRIGHLETICLCDPGHHQRSPTDLKISRHPFKARFEEAYGTEQELLSLTRFLVAQRAARMVA
jgi:hypothetical protein